MSGNWITDGRRWAIYARDHFACIYCGASILHDRAVRLTLDHVMPRSAGGSHKSSNLVTCCVFCNSVRRETSIAQFCANLIAEDVPAAVVAAIPARVRAATKRPVNLAEGKVLAANAKATSAWGFAKYIKG